MSPPVRKGYPWKSLTLTPTLLPKRTLLGVRPWGTRRKLARPLPPGSVSVDVIFISRDVTRQSRHPPVPCHSLLRLDALKWTEEVFPFRRSTWARNTSLLSQWVRSLRTLPAAEKGSTAFCASSRRAATAFAPPFSRPEALPITNLLRPAPPRSGPGRPRCAPEKTFYAGTGTLGARLAGLRSPTPTLHPRCRRRRRTLGGRTPRRRRRAEGCISRPSC